MLSEIECYGEIECLTKENVLVKTNVMEKMNAWKINERYCVVCVVPANPVIESQPGKPGQANRIWYN